VFDEMTYPVIFDGELVGFLSRNSKESQVQVIVNISSEAGLLWETQAVIPMIKNEMGNYILVLVTEEQFKNASEKFIENYTRIYSDGWIDI